MTSTSLFAADDSNVTRFNGGFVFPEYTELPQQPPTYKKAYELYISFFDGAVDLASFVQMTYFPENFWKKHSPSFPLEQSLDIIFNEFLNNYPPAHREKFMAMYLGSNVKYKANITEGIVTLKDTTLVIHIPESYKGHNTLVKFEVFKSVVFQAGLFHHLGQSEWQTDIKKNIFYYRKIAKALSNIFEHRFFLNFSPNEMSLLFQKRQYFSFRQRMKFNISTLLNHLNIKDLSFEERTIYMFAEGLGIPKNMSNNIPKMRNYQKETTLFFNSLEKNMNPSDRAPSPKVIIRSCLTLFSQN
ncbi:MAG: hypothetical protein HOO06_10120 [Bdellovibrionaceae bacterium]|nr:hypothetical protein [Pseudobdellovibrionaceae bacterium]